MRSSNQKLSRETSKLTEHPTGTMLKPNFIAKCRKWEEMGNMRSLPKLIVTRTVAFYNSLCSAYRKPSGAPHKSRLPPCPGRALHLSSEGELAIQDYTAFPHQSSAMSSFQVSHNPGPEGSKLVGSVRNVTPPATKTSAKRRTQPFPGKSG